MRFLLSLVLVAALAYGAWPYFHLYRLDNALAEDNAGVIRNLVDMEQLRENLRRQQEWRLEHRIDSTVGENGHISEMLKKGARWVSEQGGEPKVDPAWVRQRLLDARPHEVGGLLQNTDFAFFESADRFIVRLGRLGEDPTHLRFRRAGWNWYLTGIYD